MAGSERFRYLEHTADAKFQAPQFNGFNAEELQDRNSHRTLVNGREFIVTEVIFILTPVRTGDLEIEPAVLQVGLLLRSRRPRPFAGMDATVAGGCRDTRLMQQLAAKWMTSSREWRYSSNSCNCL